MKRLTDSTSLLLVAVLAAAAAAPACDSEKKSKKRVSDDDEQDERPRGPSASALCQGLAHPTFESRSDWDGSGCSGSTTFGTKDKAAGAFSYGVTGRKDAIETVMLTMAGRPDSADFFLAEAKSTAKLLTGKSLPQEIADGIAAFGPDRKKDLELSGFKLELTRRDVQHGRTAADSFYQLRFEK